MARTKAPHVISNEKTTITLSDFSDWLKSTCEIEVPSEDLSESWRTYLNLTGELKDQRILDAMAGLVGLEVVILEKTAVPILAGSRINIDWKTFSAEAKSGRLVPKPDDPMDED